jgi:ATPase subunit of ABC transporter with duplicated ATPase domains
LHPRNNLDINSIRWLEDVLNQRASTMVIISHDWRTSFPASAAWQPD